MGFTKKTWKNRIAEYINRRLLTKEDGSTELVTVARDEGTISQEGDAFNAANMNDLEDRIEAEFNNINQSLENYIDVTSNKNSIVNNSGAGFVYSKTGNKVVVHCIGYLNTDATVNDVLCDQFPVPVFGFGNVSCINLSTGVHSSCLIDPNGQLLTTDTVLKAENQFAICGSYICQ